MSSPKRTASKKRAPAKSSSSTKRKAPKKQKMLTLKQLDVKLKSANKVELRELLASLYEKHQDILAEDIENFAPGEVKIDEEDPLSDSCFHCGDYDSLRRLRELKICTGCYRELYGGNYAGTITRMQVQKYFGFTPAKAKKIPSVKKSSRFGGTCNVYNTDTVVTAAIEEHGSLYKMAKFIEEKKQKKLDRERKLREARQAQA